MRKEKVREYTLIIICVICLIAICVYVVKVNSNNVVNVGSDSSIDTVLDKDSVTEVNIEIDEDTWQQLLDNAIDEEYYSADITINGETFYNVGIRAKGNSSLTSIANDDTTDRYSFKINFDKYVENQTYNGLEKISLNNNYSDSTYMKEYLSYEVFSSLGVPTPEYSYANVTVNGEAWGLYLAIEDIEERYIEKYYGSVDGNLYKPETMEMNGDMALRGEGMINPNFESNENNVEVNGESSSQENLGLDTNKNMQNNFPGNVPDNISNNMMQGTIPEGMSENIPEGIDESMIPYMPNENMQGMGRQGLFGRDSGGADLKYIDDNISSYSTITDSAEFDTTTEEDFQTIVDMIKNLNNGENLEEYLNVEEILKYFAVNTFLVNLDSYSGGMYHNYYLYERDGVFEILPWDLNMSFGGYGISDANSAVNFPIDSPVLGDLEDAPLIGKLLEVDSYKELYHSYLNTLIETYIDNDGLVNLVDKVDNLINDYVKNDATAFYTYEEYENSLPELKRFIQDRGTSIIAQLNGEQPSTEYGDIEATFDLSALGGHGAGMPGKNNMPGNINGDGEQQAFPNMNDQQAPFNMDGENMPQLPEGMENGNIPQMQENNETTVNN